MTNTVVVAFVHIVVYSVSCALIILFVENYHRPDTEESHSFIDWYVMSLCLARTKLNLNLNL